MGDPGRCVITIGTFDGVHVGHRALVAAARRMAAVHDQRTGRRDPPTRVVAMAFDPHPASVLRPGTEPERLTSWRTRANLLRMAGADEVVRLEPTPDVLGLSAEAFVHWVVGAWRPIAFVEGSDFRFGKGRLGDVGALRAMGRGRPEVEQFAVHVVDPVSVGLVDHTVVAASSTIARWLVAHGRVGDAARVLGSAYVVEGQVVRGDRRGRTLGYPTANVAPESMLPANGVYAAIARVIPTDGEPTARGGEPGVTYRAAVSVGTKPQFTPAQTVRTIEAHLIDADRDPGRIELPGVPEYGWRLRLEFVGWLREQRRFEGVPGLVRQIERDCAEARKVIDRAGTLHEAALEPRESPA